MILLLLETVGAVFDNIGASAHSTVVGFLDHTAYLIITYFSSTTNLRKVLRLKTQTALGSALTHTRFEEENALVIIFSDLNLT